MLAATPTKLAVGMACVSAGRAFAKTVLPDLSVPCGSAHASAAGTAHATSKPLPARVMLHGVEAIVQRRSVLQIALGTAGAPAFNPWRQTGHGSRVEAR